MRAGVLDQQSLVCVLVIVCACDQRIHAVGPAGVAQRRPHHHDGQGGDDEDAQNAHLCEKKEETARRRERQQCTVHSDGNSSGSGEARRLIRME